MPALIKEQGRAAQPSFYTEEKQTASKPRGSNLPFYAVLVAIGVAIIYVLRNHDRVQTAPVLTLVPSYEADMSTITNLTNTVETMSGRPSTTTPIVWSPNATS